MVGKMKTYTKKVSDMIYLFASLICMVVIALVIIVTCNEAENEESEGCTWVNEDGEMIHKNEI